MTSSPPMFVPLALYLTLYKLLDAKMSDLYAAPSPSQYGVFAETRIVTPKIIIVGLNPSDDSPDNSAFHPDTKSGKTVKEWTKDIDGHVKYLNLWPHKNKDKGKPTLSQLTLPANMDLWVAAGWKVVGCGNIVQQVLKKNNIAHFAIPHPSGLNRFWNDKVAGEAKIQELRKWIQNK